MKSLWMDFEMPRFPSLSGEIQTDVLIIGGGMAGLLCAYRLQEQGVRCIVVEADRIASAVTGNTTAKLTSQHGLIYHKLEEKYGLEAAGMYLKANETALAAYRDLCRRIDCDFEEQSNYIYTLRSKKLLEKELLVLQKLNFPAEMVETLPLPLPTLGAVRFPGQAQFHPRKFLAAIAKNLTIFENTPIRQFTRRSAVTDYGNIRSEKIIVATHFPFLNKHGSYFMKLYQQRSYVLALEGTPLPGGMYLDEQENGLSFRTAGSLLLLGGGGHRTGKQGGGWKELEQFAQVHYPDAVIQHHWATQDCITLDGIPYIGQYSARTPNLYVATGFNKWGMTSSMAAAQLLTDQILGRDNPSAALFSPSRSMLHAQLAVNALESTVNLLMPTTPRCPHLGCALKWNPQEHSWDCPCHGSRFSKDGKLLENPATGDLK